MNKIFFIGFITQILVGECLDIRYLSAPRSVSGFGSEQMLHSYALFNQKQTSLQIIVYNEDLSYNTSYEIDGASESWQVESCDQYYLAVPAGAREITIISFDETTHNLLFANIPLEDTFSNIAVSPSGLHFAYQNDWEVVYLYEITPRTFNWNMTTIRLPQASTYLKMSNTELRFISGPSCLHIYNYITGEATTRNLYTTAEIRSFDTYNDYWIYVSNLNVLLEDPNGQLRVFNFSESMQDTLEWMWPLQATILPDQLRTNKNNTDIVLVSTTLAMAIIGTLNPLTHCFEEYNSVPSKSLGLDYYYNGVQVHNDPNFPGTDGHLNPGLLDLTPGYYGLVMQLADNDRSVAIALPASPGNHSCCVTPAQGSLWTYWCSWSTFDPSSPCPFGTYQPSYGYTRCLLCPEGTYQSNAGSVSCLACKDDEYCPMGAVKPEKMPPLSRKVSWVFPISVFPPSFEETLIMLMFTSSIYLILAGLIVITSVLLLSLLLKHFCGIILLHQWMAKIDLHKKNTYRFKHDKHGALKAEPHKVGSVFGGYLTLLAVYILAIGLITTIIYVLDYIPLMVETGTATEPSQNSVRKSSLQDYDTQSEAAGLANIVKDNLFITLKLVLFNFHPSILGYNPVHSFKTTNCFTRDGVSCDYNTKIVQSYSNDTTAFIYVEIDPIRIEDTQIELNLLGDSPFTWGTIEVDASNRASNSNGIRTNMPQFKKSMAKYNIMPGTNRALTGKLLIPITMTVVVRETEIATDEFNRDAYISFTSDEQELQRLGHSEEVFDRTNEPMSFKIMLQMDDNWRLESEQPRFGGVEALIAAMLAILGLYEVTLLASELTHRLFHVIEKCRKKRRNYHSVEDAPLINEKVE